MGEIEKNKLTAKPSCDTFRLNPLKSIVINPMVVILGLCSFSCTNQQILPSFSGLGDFTLLNQCVVKRKPYSSPGMFFQRRLLVEQKLK